MASEPLTDPTTDAPGEPDQRWSAAEDPSPRQGLGMMAGVVALLIAGLLMVLLVLQNTNSVRVQLLWFDADVPLAALILGTAFIAIVLEEIAGLVWRRRRRRLLDLEDRVG